MTMDVQPDLRTDRTDLLRVVPDEPSEPTPTLSVSSDAPSPPAKKRRMPRHRRDLVAKLLRDAGEYGLTWRELGEILDVNHGSASGVLSVLNDEGVAVRTLTRRGGCGVYVLTEHADPENIAPRRRSGLSPAAAQEEFERGVAVGRDEGWTAGYDDGVSAAASDTERTRKAAFDAMRYRIQEILGAMNRDVNPNTASVHYGNCWQIHPGCAIRAARKAVDNTHAKMINT